MITIGLKGILRRAGRRTFSRCTPRLSLPQTSQIRGDWDTLIVPSEQPGNHLDFNWSLCMHEVAPVKDAFRNLPADELIARATGKKSSVLQTTTDESVAVHTVLFSDPSADEVLNEKVNLPSDPRFGSIPPFRYGKLFEKVSGELEFSSVYAHDWFVGDIPLRVISDDPAMALFVRNISGSIAAPSAPATDFADEASVIFHSSKVDVLASGIKMNSKAFSVLNASFNGLLLGGTNSKTAMIDAISSIVANNLALDKAYGHRQALLLRCDTLTSNGTTTAVFGDTPLIHMMDEFSGAHAHILSDGTLSRVFGGVARERASPKSHPGDLVETVKFGEESYERVTSILSSPSPLGPLRSIVFVVNDSSKTLAPLAQLTTDQIFHHYFYGSRGISVTSAKPCFSSSPVDVHSHAEAFVAAVETMKIPVYLVNKASVGDVAAAQIVRALALGEVPDVKPHKALGMQVAASLGAVDVKNFKSTGITAASVRKLSTSRQAELLEQHGAVSDRVLQGGLPQ